MSPDSESFKQFVPRSFDPRSLVCFHPRRKFLAIIVVPLVHAFDICWAVVIESLTNSDCERETEQKKKKKRGGKQCDFVLIGTDTNGREVINGKTERC
jgi:hypothetical protein